MSSHNKHSLDYNDKVSLLMSQSGLGTDKAAQDTISFITNSLDEQEKKTSQGKAFH